MNIGEPIKSPCEGGKCTSLHDEVRGAAHSRCEKHKKMFDTLSQSKKEGIELPIMEPMKDGYFKVMLTDMIQFNKDYRAADRVALIRAVEGMKKSEFGDKDKPFYGTGIARRFSYAYNAALDDVLALLHSPEK